MEIRPHDCDWRILQTFVSPRRQIGQALDKPVLRRIEAVEGTANTDIVRHCGIHCLGKKQIAVGDGSCEFLQGVPRAVQRS